MPERRDASAASLLPPSRGYEGLGQLHWHQMTLADNDALIELLSRIEAHDDPPYRTTPEESAETFTATASNIDQAMVLGRDGDGTARAYGMVRIRPGHTHDRALCDGGVEPAWRGKGVGSDVLAWQVDVARQIMRESGREGAWAMVHVEDGPTDTAVLLRSRGFDQARRYTEMRRDLAQPLPEIAPASGIRVEPWREELDDAVRRAHNDAFANEWGAEPHTPQTWIQGRTFFAPEWSFIAMDHSSDRARVAGYLMSGRYEVDWAAQGWTEGYTEVLGVRKEWRGAGVATALLATAMRAYAVDGMAYAGLGVNMAGPVSDYGLFTHLGYEPTRSSAMYTMAL